MAEIAEEAGERVGDVVESVVESAVAGATAQVIAAEQRAEAAEAVAEVMADSARRDAIFEECEALIEEGLETCRTELLGNVEGLRAEVQSLRTEMAEVREKMAQPLQVTVAQSTQEPLPEPVVAETPVAETVVTVEPASAKDAPTVAVPVARAKQRRWI